MESLPLEIGIEVYFQTFVQSTLPSVPFRTWKNFALNQWYQVYS